MAFLPAHSSSERACRHAAAAAYAQVPPSACPTCAWRRLRVEISGALLHERARAKGKSGAYPGNSSAAKESPVQAARLAEECTKMMQTRRGHSWERLTLSPLLVPPK